MRNDSCNPGCPPSPSLLAVSCSVRPFLGPVPVPVPGSCMSHRHDPQPTRRKRQAASLRMARSLKEVESTIRIPTPNLIGAVSACQSARFPKGTSGEPLKGPGLWAARAPIRCVRRIRLPPSLMSHMMSHEFIHLTTSHTTSAPPRHRATCVGWCWATLALSGTSPCTTQGHSPRQSVWRLRTRARVGRDKAQDEQAKCTRWRKTEGPTAQTFQV